jgi:hypothetical protein
MLALGCATLGAASSARYILRALTRHREKFAEVVRAPNETKPRKRRNKEWRIRLRPKCTLTALELNHTNIEI